MRTRLPTVNAEAVDARFVVTVVEPIAIVSAVTEVRL